MQGVDHWLLTRIARAAAPAAGLLALLVLQPEPTRLVGAPSVPVAACAGGAVADFWPEKMLPKKFETPLPPWDWAKAGPDSNSAATVIAAVRLVIAHPIQRMSHPPPGIPFQKALSRFPTA